MKLFWNPSSAEHVTGQFHPENFRRIERLLQMLRERYEELGSCAVNDAAVLDLVHTSDHVELIRRSAGEARDLLMLDDDTYLSSGSFDAACTALALHQAGIDYCCGERGRKAFIISRPPGHHAGVSSAAGFCLYNNVAHAARYAQVFHGIRRVAIVDWDVHHGNGTEEIFYEDDHVLFISLHAYPHWPYGHGGAERRGEGRGRGYNLNLPLPVEAGDLQYMKYFDRFVIPSLESFRPELLLVSAGFDAHLLERNSSTDIKSRMAVTDAGYSWMTSELLRFASRSCNGRILFTLEGGYYLPSLETGVEAVLQTILMGGDPLPLNPYSEGSAMDIETFEEYIEWIRRSL